MFVVYRVFKPVKLIFSAFLFFSILKINIIDLDSYVRKPTDSFRESMP